MELLTGAAGMVTLASNPLRAQSDKRAKAPAGIVEPPKFSPANIGGGGRIERDFYRDWLKKAMPAGIFWKARDCFPWMRRCSRPFAWRSASIFNSVVSGGAISPASHHKRSQCLSPSPMDTEHPRRRLRSRGLFLSPVVKLIFQPSQCYSQLCQKNF